MKNALLLLLTLSLLSLEPSLAQCPVDSILRQAYERDVKDLALRRIIAFDHPDKSAVEIPQIWQDSIWNGLAAIFNSLNIPERDTIFNIFCIHHDSPQQSALVDEIYISTNTAWTYDSLTLHLNTGNPVLDSFLLRHGIIYRSVFAPGIIRAQTARIINTQALMDSLETFPEVNYTEPVFYAGDANQIRYRTENGEQFFDFHLRWGDCPAGCINRRIWQFKVSSGCTVQYLGKTDQFGGGYPFPQPPLCNISISTGELVYFESLSDIYPNPFHHTLNFRLLKPGPASLTLSDVSGRILGVYSLLDELNLPAGALKPGVYVVRLFQKDKIAVRKVVKL